jgi:type I restriction enzyme M protein
VIGLPPNLFYSTSIPACLLIFKAERPADRRGGVLFLDGSGRFFKGRNQNQMDEDDVAAIVAAYRNGESPDSDENVHVRQVTHAEITANGWDLNISRYLKTAVAEDITVETALDELSQAQAALHEAEARLAERLKAAGYA